jgi:ribulose kinase
MIRGIGFDATCSLAVLSTEDDSPVSVTSPAFDTDRNVILWLDHRAVEETERINATGHKVLQYLGGAMSVEMEIPKILWLRNNMSAESFSRCKFYDLVDALTHLATGSETRSLCCLICKQGYLPKEGDDSVSGWPKDFLDQIGLETLSKTHFHSLGGINGEVRYSRGAFLVVCGANELTFGVEIERSTSPRGRIGRVVV